MESLTTHVLTLCLCSLQYNRIGNEGAAAFVELLKGNETVLTLKCVYASMQT